MTFPSLPCTFGSSSFHCLALMLEELPETQVKRKVIKMDPKEANKHNVKESKM